jgi:hypothetical protein
MAGAGGLFVMLIGAVIALRSGGLTLALFRFGFRRLAPRWARALGLVAIVGGHDVSSPGVGARPPRRSSSSPRPAGTAIGREAQDP